MNAVDFNDTIYVIQILACLMNLYILNDGKRAYGKNEKYEEWTEMLCKGLQSTNNIIQLNTSIYKF